jgi:hypothetical protein
MDERALKMLLAGKQLEIDKLKRTIKEMEENDNARQRDSEIRKTSKRSTKSSDSINDLSIYGIYPTNFPKLIQVLEHAKDHIKAEITATRKRIIEHSTIKVEEVYTDPLKTEAQKNSDNINDMYSTKGI